MTENADKKTPRVKPDTSSHWLWLSFIIIGLDQVTKWMIVQNFALYDSVKINSVLNITRLHNTGAAFSFLQDAGGWQRWLFVGLASVVSVAILVWLRKLPRQGYRWLALALALVLGGAIGNVIDRVNYHYVVDFIQVHWEDAYFPTFNVADIAISVGAFLLIMDSFFGSGKTEKAPPPESEPAETKAD
ncbi:MAG: signal peptidase II [Woeseiaceae bacterium]